MTKTELLSDVVKQTYNLKPRRWKQEFKASLGYEPFLRRTKTKNHPSSVTRTGRPEAHQLGIRFRVSVIDTLLSCWYNCCALSHTLQGPSLCLRVTLVSWLLLQGRHCLVFVVLSSSLSPLRGKQDWLEGRGPVYLLSPVCLSSGNVLLPLWDPLTCVHVFGELTCLQEEPEISAFLRLRSGHFVAGHRSYNWRAGSRRVVSWGTLAPALFTRGPGTSYFWADRVGRAPAKTGAGSQLGLNRKHTNIEESLAMDAFQGLGWYPLWSTH